MISPEQLRDVAHDEMGEGGLFVYDRVAMHEIAQDLQDHKMPFGMTVRYAAKANSHPEVIACFDDMGLSFDASSAPEAERLLNYGVEASKISLSSQVLRGNHLLGHLLNEGVLPVATSLRQVGMLGEAGLESIAVRMNPGEGSGGNKRTTVGGPASSFGIWKDQLPEVLEVAKRTGVTIDRIHTHIGSGVDPSMWRTTIQNSLGIVEQCPESVTALDIGGGYKIARVEGEPATDMNEVLDVFAEEIEEFAGRTGREIHLEIEPGTMLVGNAGTLVGRVEETVSTNMYDFLRLNVGMNAILRPSLYGAQHPIEVLNNNEEERDYVVVGPCCESGDILTPTRDEPEEIQPRTLRVAEVGDYIAIGGVGAYAATMSANKYNDIPEATEIAV